MHKDEDKKDKQYGPYWKPGVNLGAPEWQAVPASYTNPTELLTYIIQ